MQQLVPPLCLLLALAMLIAGFAVWSVDPPEVGDSLHRARVAGDDQFTEVLEADLKARQWKHRFLLIGLFSGSVLMTFLAFLSMSESKQK